MNRMRTGKWMGAGVLAAGVLLGVSQVSFGELQNGTTPTFSFRLTNGQEVTNEILKGHVTVFDFWATWCGPCMHEMPHMLKLYAKYHPQNVVFVGISLDQSRQSLDKVVNQRHIPWPMYFDGGGWHNRMARAWGINSIPKTYILGPGGKVLWHGHPARIDGPLAAAVKQFPKATTDRQKKAASAGDKTKNDPPVATSGESHGPATQPTSSPSAQRQAILTKLYAQAAKQQAAGHDIPAYQQFKRVALAGKGTDVGKAAAAAVTTYEADKAFMAKLKAHQAELAAHGMVSLAHSYALAGKTDEAMSLYRKVVKRWPHTQAADQARQALAKANG